MANKTIIEAEITSNVGDVTKDVDKLDKSTKEASGGFKGMGKSIRGIGTALKAAGIGLIVGLFAKLAEVFTQNQKVVDTFNTAMEFLSITFNDFFKFIQNNLNTATGFFDKIFGNTAVKQVLEFGKTLGIEVITRVKNLIQGIGGLGKALMQVFKGDFKEALETSKESLLNFKDAVTGNTAETIMMEHQIVKITDKIKDYTKANLDSAKALVDVRKQSELARVQVQGLIEEFDRQAEKLRQVRDDESKTFQERIDANNELGDVLRKQEQEMLKLVEIQIKAAQLDVDKNNSLENQIALEEALNEKKAVQAQITGFQSEQLVNNISLQKEQKQVALDNVTAQLDAYSSLAGSLSELAGENKALAVAQAVIDTYAAANGALAAGKGTPLAMLQAAAIIVSGLANVKKIMAVDVGSGGGGGVPSASPETPAPQMLGGAFTLGGGEQPEPLKAFVVTDEMTNSQNQLANIRRRATI
tara:strand:+ start:3074 stop:4489 length:1416 start_codon:yes stop_codon:yes gene_type:complete